MPDNVGYTPGSGATVAADEIGGALHQRVKIGVGTDGTAVDVSDTNPLPVDVGTNSGLSMLLTRMLGMLLAPLGYSRDLQRFRNTAILESGTLTTCTTVTTVTTCATVTACTNVVNLGGLSADRLVLNQNYSAWASTNRVRIT
jgi:hypothetical protein